MSLLGILGCEVEEVKTSTTQSCIFPFELGQVSFKGCTTMFHPQNKTWCATKVDAEGTYIFGFWGYCHENCPLDVNGTSIKILLSSKIIICRLFNSKMPFLCQTVLHSLIAIKNS